MPAYAARPAPANHVGRRRQRAPAASPSSEPFHPTTLPRRFDSPLRVVTTHPTDGLCIRASGEHDKTCQDCACTSDTARTRTFDAFPTVHCAVCGSDRRDRSRVLLRHAEIAPPDPVLMPRHRGSEPAARARSAQVQAVRRQNPATGNCAQAACPHAGTVRQRQGFGQCRRAHGKSSPSSAAVAVIRPAASRRCRRRRGNRRPRCRPRSMGGHAPGPHRHGSRPAGRQSCRSTSTTHPRRWRS